MSLYLLFHRRVAEHASAATMPSITPNTTDSGPCAMCHALFDEPCTAMLMKMVYLRACRHGAVGSAQRVHQSSWPPAHGWEARRDVLSRSTGA